VKILIKIADWIDTLNEYVGRGVAWVTLGLVMLVFVDVGMRYLLNISFVFNQEMEWHLFAFIFLIGAGYTLLHDGHVRVDIIYQRLGFKAKAWVNFIGVIFFLFPGCFLIIMTSMKFVITSWSMMEGSPDPGGVPFRFILKSAIPVGFGLLFLQGASLGIHSLLQILGLEMNKEGDS
jgi:TRAP-type mannitol/chloroaromatic compound transport system permease small subunit